MKIIFLIGLILLLPDVGQGKTRIKKYDYLQVEAESYFRQGLKLYENFRFEEAVVAYKKALDLKPELTEAWYWLGKSYYRNGLTEQAVSAWQRFLDMGGGKQHKDLERKIKMYTQPHLKATRLYHHLATLSGQGTTGEDSFSQPVGVAIDKKDNFFVLSFGSHAVLKFSPVGDFLARVGSKGKRKGQLNQPFGLALDGLDNMYVTDWKNNRVEKFSPTGKCLLVLGEKGRGRGKFSGPEGIAVGKEGIIYVVDNGNSRVEYFSPTGKFLGQIGQFGHGPKDFFHPVGAVLDNKGGLWITDTGNKSLKRYDLSGNFKQAFLFPEKKAEGRGITFGPDLNIYVAFTNGHIWRFNPQEEAWHKLEIKVSLVNPTGLAINKHGVIYIADFDKGQVEIVMPERFEEEEFDLTIEEINTYQYPVITYRVMVTTKSGQPVLGLTNKNFKVMEAGEQISPIIVNSPLVENDCLIVSFVLDCSAKMAKYRAEVKKLLYQFVKDIKSERQAVSLIGVAEKVILNQSNTRNKTTLRDCIDQLEYQGKGDEEALFSALTLTTKDLLCFTAKRIIVLFSPGEEISMGTLFKKAAWLAKNNHIPIFVVDFRKEGRTESLAKLAEMSRGKYILAHNSKEAVNLHQAITNYTAYQNPYLITYKSLEWQWPNHLTDVEVWAGYHRLVAKEAGDYLVPAGKGISSERAEAFAQKFEVKKLAERIKEYEKEHKWKEKLRLTVEAEKKAASGGGHGEGAKKKVSPPIEENFEIHIGSPVRPAPGSEEAAKPAAEGHGGGH